MDAVVPNWVRKEIRVHESRYAASLAALADIRAAIYFRSPNEALDEISERLSRFENNLTTPDLVHWQETARKAMNAVRDGGKR